MLNEVVIQGRLTGDIELKHTASDVPVCSFSLACERDYKPEGGERETDFLDIVAWRSTAVFVSKYFTKGRMMIVHGRLQVQRWTDDTGKQRRNVEIVADQVYFGDSKKDGQSVPSLAVPAGQAPNLPSSNDFAMLEDDDHQLPF